eukprot:12641533-Alexandrium_andersonii.AAC.1
MWGVSPLEAALRGARPEGPQHLLPPGGEAPPGACVAWGPLGRAPHKAASMGRNSPHVQAPWPCEGRTKTTAVMDVAVREASRA